MLTGFIILICILVVLLALKVPIFLAFLLLAMGGFIYFLGTEHLQSAIAMSWGTLNQFPLTAVPLFILMSELITFSGLGSDVFNSLANWSSRLPGGLAHVVVVACALFGAVSGSSVTGTIMLGKVALPTLRQRGYRDELTLSTLAASGTLGILIPPSIPMIIFGSLAGVSAAKLFMGGILPGIICTVMFSIAIVIWVKLRPNIAEPTRPFVLSHALRQMVKILPVLVLAFVVLGSIYLGVATPTEAAAIGTTASIILLLIMRRITWKAFRESFVNTVVTTSAILIIMAMAAMLTYLMAFIGIHQDLMAAIMGVGEPWKVIVIISIVYIILGMFIEPVSMMVLTIPFFAPIIVSMGYNLVWFGIMLVILIMIGNLTPPVGMNLFALSALGSDVEFRKVVRGIPPFLYALIILLFLVAIFPGLALWLPSAMK